MTSPTRTDRLPVIDQPGLPPTLTVSAPADVRRWAAEHRDAVRAAVAEHGSLLIRGLGLRTNDDVRSAANGLVTAFMSEREAFAARSDLGSGLYSSSTWPANQPMCMHHEVSYASPVPGLMLFACLVPPTDGGGATGVADAPTVLNALPADLVDRFEREGWQLVRSYNDEIGATVADSFGTDDPAAVAQYCQVNGIDAQWQPDGSLRTVQRRPAVVRHPLTGQRCWFNQIAFLSEWTLDPEVREFLIDMYGEDGLPFTTRYGNGEPIPEDVVQLLNEVYDEHTRRDAWQAGDLLLVDNIRTAHSREPFTGPRQVVVALADPVDLSTLVSPSTTATTPA